MEQARNLANFPIGCEDRHFGPAVRRAKTTFIDFRETVRREAISIIEPQIQEARLTELLALPDDKANISVEELEALERDLSTRTPD